MSTATATPADVREPIPATRLEWIAVASQTVDNILDAARWRASTAWVVSTTDSGARVRLVTEKDEHVDVYAVRLPYGPGSLIARVGASSVSTSFTDLTDLAEKVADLVDRHLDGNGYWT
jgi:hypothetical protein